MYQQNRIVSIIPLRGGSKSIPYKNIKLIAGKPLAYWVCKAASESKYIDAIYVSTEDAKIKEVINGLGLRVEVVDRPLEFAQDTSMTEDLFPHFMTQVPDFDVLNLIQATGPFTTAEDLDLAIEYFFEGQYDSLLTGVLYKKFYWTLDGKPMNFHYLRRPRRQEFEGVVNENGAFYLTKKEILEKHKNRLGGNIGIYVMPEEKAVDIDEPSDWELAEQLLLKQLEK